MGTGLESGTMKRTSPLPKLVALAVALVLAARAAAAEPRAEPELYERGLKAAVWVVTPSERAPDQVLSVEASPDGVRSTRVRRYGVGSGLVIDAERRLILTNAHVVGDSDRTQVCFPMYRGDGLVEDQRAYWRGARRVGGQVLARDTARDLAVVKLDRLPPGTRSFSLAQESPRPGDTVYSIGNPGESKKMWVCRSGAVLEDRRQQVRARDKDGKNPTVVVRCRMLVTDWLSEPGESGSPVFNGRGELVGLVSSIRPESHETFGIDVSEVKAFLRSEKVRAALPPAPAKGQVARGQKEETPETPEQEAARKLRMARSLDEAGVTDRARARYRQIVEHYPGTEAARQAERLLGDGGAPRDGD